VTARKNDERILVSGGTWIRGNKQTLPQSFPCLVIWDETEWLICDNEGLRALIGGPKFGWRSRRRFAEFWELGTHFYTVDVRS
jgi:hypothetical protein